MVDILIMYDPLFHNSTEEINIIKAGGYLDEKVFINHIYGFSILQKLIDKDVGILDKEYDIIKELMDKEMEVFYEQITKAPSFNYLPE